MGRAPAGADRLVYPYSRRRARMRIAHLTDLHFQSLASARWRDLLGKRAIGAAHLRLFGRQRHFDNDVARLAIQAVRDVAPDFIAVTGDISALSLDDEFAMGRDALAPALDATPSLLIAGNHDIYTQDARPRFESFFSSWMGSATATGLRITRHDNVTFVGCDGARPTLIGSRGYIPGDQLADLASILARERPAVLLLHYPVVTFDGRPYHAHHRWHCIENAPDLLRVIERHPPALILHGHVHRGFSAACHGVPVENPGAAGHAFQVAPSRAAAFNVYDVRDGDLISVQRYAHDGQRFVAAG